MHLSCEAFFREGGTRAAFEAFALPQHTARALLWRAHSARSANMEALAQQLLHLARGRGASRLEEVLLGLVQTLVPAAAGPKARISRLRSW